MDRVPTDGEGKARGRLAALTEAGVQTSIGWYADHPTHYQGDAKYATAEAGNALLDAKAQFVAKAVRAIKADTEAQRLFDEFHARGLSPKLWGRSHRTVNRPGESATPSCHPEGEGGRGSYAWLRQMHRAR